MVACAGGPSISPSTQDPAASGDPAFLPTIVSSELAKGPTRFLFSLTDRENRLLASPDLKVSLDFYDADAAPETVVFQEVARFIWAVEGERGLYVADVDFPDFGRWAARFEATLPDGQIESVRSNSMRSRRLALRRSVRRCPRSKLPRPRPWETTWDA